MQRFSRILCILFLSALASCSDDVQPPQPEAFLGKHVLTAVRDLSRAYEARDSAAFLALVAPDLPGRETWERSIAAVFARYEKVSLRFQGTKMLAMTLEHGPVRTSVNWEGEWRTGGGDIVRDGGRVTLVFEQGSFLLTAIEGKDPFLPSERPAVRQ